MCGFLGGTFGGTSLRICPSESGLPSSGVASNSSESYKEYFTSLRIKMKSCSILPFFQRKAWCDSVHLMLKWSTLAS